MTTNNNFDLSLAESLVNSNKQFPVDFDDAWQWLEFSRKDSGKRHFDNSGFTENFDFNQFHTSVELAQGGNTYKIKINLTIECFKTWAMMVNTKKGKEVRLYFLECEKIAKDKLAQAITPEIDAVEKVKQFNEILDSIFSNTKIVPELISGFKLNTAKKFLPEMAEELELTRQLLINSTAKEETLMTVTQLGKLLNPSLTALKTNQLLINKGYQVKNINKKSQKDLSYMPTDKAKDHCSITLATGNGKSDTYQQLRWFNSIAQLIN